MRTLEDRRTITSPDIEMELEIARRKADHDACRRRAKNGTGRGSQRKREARRTERAGAAAQQRHPDGSEPEQSAPAHREIDCVV